MILVLPDLPDDLEQFQDNGGGLCAGQPGMLQDMHTQMLMQDIGCAMQDQPHAVGEEGGAGGSVCSQIALDLFDEVLGLTACAVCRKA